VHGVVLPVAVEDVLEVEAGTVELEHLEVVGVCPREETGDPQESG
jgi:hypothetical protein